MLIVVYTVEDAAGNVRRNFATVIQDDALQLANAIGLRVRAHVLDPAEGKIIADFTPMNRPQPKENAP